MAPSHPTAACNPFIVLDHAWQAMTDCNGGGVIECGVFHGFTSAVLNFGLRKHGTPFRQYAADTFAGFPVAGKKDEKYKAGELNPGSKTIADLERLGINVIEGKVEDTLATLPEDERFCFVFLDLDHEAPTKFCWQALRGRLLLSARIGFHDYGVKALPGIKRVVDKILKGGEFVECFRRNRDKRDPRFVFIKRKEK